MGFKNLGFFTFLRKKVKKLKKVHILVFKVFLNLENPDFTLAVKAENCCFSV